MIGAIGRSREIILGEILAAHLAEAVVDGRLRIDPAALDPAARLGGDTCCTTRDQFEMAAPSLEAWREARATG